MTGWKPIPRVVEENDDLQQAHPGEAEVHEKDLLRYYHRKKTTTTCLMTIAMLLLLRGPARASIDRSPEDEITYFIMPDRFLDGDPTNNYGGDEQQGSTREEVLRHGYLPTHKGYYHGGD